MKPPDLVPQIYDELRKLAAVKLTGEQPGHTLDPTALVNEAWLRLAGDSFSTRSGFFRAAAMAMRRILVDHARARKAKKRGGDQVRTGLDLDHLASLDSHQDIEEIDAALEEIAAVDPQAAEHRLVHHSVIVELNISSYRMDAAKKQRQRQTGSGAT